MRFLSVFVFVLVVLTGCQVSQSVEEVVTVSPAVASARVFDEKAILIDVREPEEWAETGVAVPAHLLSLSDLQGQRVQWDAVLEELGDRELLIYCRSGNRAGVAANILKAEGFRVGNVGGFRDWEAAGLPVRRIEDPVK